jgi:hypothetical protein
MLETMEVVIAGSFSLLAHEKGPVLVISFAPGKEVNAEHGRAGRPVERWKGSTGVEFPFGFAADN